MENSKRNLRLPAITEKQVLTMTWLEAFKITCGFTVMIMFGEGYIVCKSFTQNQLSRLTKPAEAAVIETIDPDHAVETYGEHYKVNPSLVRAMIKRESSGRANALSPKGARGIMQVMPATARRQCGILDPAVLDIPSINISCGVKVMRNALEEARGNLKVALEIYNGGPQCVGRCRESLEYSAVVTKTFIEGAPTIKQIRAASSS